MKGKLLLCMVLGALTPWTAHAAEVTQLPEVYVEGDRYSDSSVMAGGKTDRQIHFGLYEGRDYMDVPANVMSYTEKTIKQNTIPARSFLNTMTNNPSVLVGGASTNNNVELQIRGIPFNTHDQLLDGIPGMMCMGIVPMNWVERIDFIAGPNVVLSSMGNNQTVSGTINLVPKIAKDTPNFDLTETCSTHRLFTHAADIGQRFGTDNRYGIRVNAEHYNGTTSFSGETLKGNDFYVHLDQRTKHSQTSFLFGYDEVVNRGMPEVLNLKKNWGNGVTHIPSAKDVVENLQPSWSDLSHSRRVFTLSHTQVLNDALSVYIKGGYQNLHWPGYWDSKPVLLNDAGDYNYGSGATSGFSSDEGSGWSRRAFTGGVNWTFKTGSVDHKVNAGYEFYSAKSWYTDGKNISYRSPAGNIFTGIWSKWTDAPINGGGPWYKTSRKIERSFALSDTITALDGDLTFILGARRQSIQTKSYNVSGAMTKKYDRSKWAPNISALYKLSPVMSVYGNYSEGLTTVSPIRGTLNDKDVFAPVKTKQYEAGLKWDFGDWGTTLSAFSIKVPDVRVSPDNYSRVDGEMKSKGLEWNIFGKIAPRLTATGGIMLLDAKYKRTNGGLNEGNRVHGAPKFNATLALDWETPVDGLTVNGRILHTGATYADTENKIKVPSWTRFDLGATYDRTIADIPMTFSLNAYNLLNRKYWSTATTRWSDGMIMLNPGRTYILSCSVHL